MRLSVSLLVFGEDGKVINCSSALVINRGGLIYRCAPVGFMNEGGARGCFCRKMPHVGVQRCSFRRVYLVKAEIK